ncbi:hypothetical protein ABH931_007981 [Streptacidiphilus sp. MAP12-33]|uniref:hypothetical protein n=1 Tax=Streptacidiphilus sp. MAP12-33 TaxID=3156266 RepID=UPI0035121C74
MNEPLGRPTVRRLLLTVTVFLTGWGATAAAALWFGQQFWPVLVVGMLTLLAVPVCVMLLGGRFLALALAVLCGIPALVAMADAVGDRVLLARGATVQAQVTSVGYGKTGNQQDCHARDAATGRAIPGTFRNCLSEGVGDTFGAIVDPQGHVAPYDGARADVADDLSVNQPIVGAALGVQALVVPVTWLWARLRRTRRR